MNRAEHGEAKAIADPRTRWICWIAVLAIVLMTRIAAQGFYNSETGRWLNRDPIQEGGGRNLCGFVGNEPISRGDRMGLVELQSVGTPGITGEGSYAFAAVWFTFSPADYAALGGNGEGTLVWSRQASWSMYLCPPTYGYYAGSLSMWFRRSFRIDTSGQFTGGDLQSQGGDVPADATGRGLGLEITGQTAAALVQSTPGAMDRVNKCGTSGGLAAQVEWAVLPGTITGGVRDEVFLAGYDARAPHSPNPLPGWDDWSGAIATGWLAVRVQWDQCVSPKTWSMSATSSQPVTDRGPDHTGKRVQGERHPWEW
jgi:hypothetical protein